MSRNKLTPRPRGCIDDLIADLEALKAAHSNPTRENSAEIRSRFIEYRQRDAYIIGKALKEIHDAASGL